LDSPTASRANLPAGALAWRPDAESLRRDALAGLVVGIIALPLSIALAVAVGVSPAAGLYTAVFAGGAAAIFGGSEFNITGPTAALVPILSHTVLVHGAEALPLVGLLAGFMLLAMSVLKLGRFMRFMPGPVILGFTAGIALSILFGQVNTFFGITGTDPTLEHFHEKLADSLSHLGTMQLATPAVAIATLLLLAGWQREARINRVPAILVAVVVMTAVTWTFGIDTPTVGSKYGAIPRGMPIPSLSFVDAGLIFSYRLPSAWQSLAQSSRF
jgi:SulP family sulfate permease